MEVRWSYQENLTAGCRGWPWPVQLRQTGMLNAVGKGQNDA